MNQKKTRAAKRFPCNFPVSLKTVSLSFLALSSGSRPQVIDSASSEILDLSEHGLRIRLRNRTIEEGTVLLIKVPVSSAPVTVPSLAQVRWIKAGKARTCEAGLKYVIE